MGKIKLDNDLEIKAPVITNEVHDASVTIDNTAINVRLDWKRQEYVQIGTADPVASGDPYVVRTEHFPITGQDYTDLATATVAQAHIGKTFFSIIRKAVRNKVKTLKALQGTVE